MADSQHFIMKGVRVLEAPWPALQLTGTGDRVHSVLRCSYCLVAHIPVNHLMPILGHAAN